MEILDLETGQQTNTFCYTFTTKTLASHELILRRAGYLEAKLEDARQLRELRENYRKAGKLIEMKAIERAIDRLK